MPEDAVEVLGLLALMEIQASRLGTRTGPDGACIPLTEKDARIGTGVIPLAVQRVARRGRRDPPRLMPRLHAAGRRLPGPPRPRARRYG
jgi:predicted RNA polymerase sigma factor